MDTEFEILKQYVLDSKYRYKALMVLSSDGVKIPSQISVETMILQNHISKVLRELKLKGLIECINEDSKKGRLYRLTSIGERVKSELSPVSQRYSQDDGRIYDTRTRKYLYLEDIVDLLNSQDKTMIEEHLP